MFSRQVRKFIPNLNPDLTPPRNIDCHLFVYFGTAFTPEAASPIMKKRKVKMIRLANRMIAAALLAAALFQCAQSDDDALKVKKGASVVLIGNNLGSRMMNYGYFETVGTSRSRSLPGRTRHSFGQPGPLRNARPMAQPPQGGYHHRFLRLQ